MAKMFGKRDKQTAAQPRPEPISSIAAAPLPRHAGPPASSTPLADQLARGGPGVSSGYVVLPRSLAEQMPLPWQQQMAALLAQFHGMHRDLSWPVYRVVPSREERLVDLDEEQLAEVGYLLEIDSAGDMVYRERSGRKVADPEETKVLVSCLDPIVTPKRQPGSPAGRAPQPEPGAAPPQRKPAPMNIGPQPVWQTVPNKASAPAGPPIGRTTPQSGAPLTPPSAAPQAPATPTESTGSRPQPAEGRREPLDWFAETPEADVEALDPLDPLDEPGDFGPTGEPIERPYG